MKLSKFGLIKFHIKKLKQFDEITAFRLKMLAVINILFSFFTPILSQYYHLLQIHWQNILIPASTLLAMFGILKTIGEKFVKYINTYTSFSALFRYMILFDFLFGIGALTYFINPVLMIWMDSILGVFHLPLFFAYANALNNHIAFFNNEAFPKFQNYRADLNAETRLLGLILAIIMTIISVKLSIIIFGVGMILLSVYQIKYIKIFKKYDFKYMLNYHRRIK